MQRANHVFEKTELQKINVADVLGAEITEEDDWNNDMYILLSSTFYVVSSVLCSKPDSIDVKIKAASRDANGKIIQSGESKNVLQERNFTNLLKRTFIKKYSDASHLTKS